MMLRLLFLTLLLSLAGQAQEVPVEVKLVPPPPDFGVNFTIESVPHQPTEPTWTPPPITCRVCLEMKVDGVCPCLEPLTQALAQTRPLTAAEDCAAICRCPSPFRLTW